MSISDTNSTGYKALCFNATSLLAAAWLSWRIWAFFRPNRKHSMRSVAVLVLGDIGRSPRMMYHAESFAENGFVTEVIGYGGSKPIPALERLPLVQLRYLPEPPALLKHMPFVIAAPAKVVMQVVSIFSELFVKIPKAPEFILVQNPPSIPTLAIVWLVGYLRGSKIIIDWHNLGYSVLALKLGQKHPFVKLSKQFEKTFGRSAYAHLFVTQAMHDYLIKEWDLQGKKLILHDRPPRHFHRASPQETHELFRRLQPTLLASKDLHDFLPKSSVPHSTPFTHVIPQPIGQKATINPTAESSEHATAAKSLPHRASISSPVSFISPANAPVIPEVQLPASRPDRPALIVSSTSWTPDEDFGILLESLGVYEKLAQEASASEAKKRLPRILVVITGKGPMRDEYMQKVGILQKGWNYVRCASLWLEAEDYPILLGSADLGVSLHSSSSALDLPMKVVDMFGCRLPVCALGFACLDELVRDGVNGLVFKDASQLAEQFTTLLEGFPNSNTRLTSLRASLTKAAVPSKSKSARMISAESNKGQVEWYWGSWDENWTTTVKPLLFRTATATS